MIGLLDVSVTITLDYNISYIELFLDNDNLHILQITTATSKPFPSLLSSSAIPWQRLLRVEVLQLNALRLYSQPPVQNSVLN
jgi:hypothetical protein